MFYKDQTIKKYLDDLAAKLPAPGGGSAAALNAALGVSLLSMVANFTAGKPKYSKYEPDLQKILAGSEKLRGEFLNLVDLDVSAYNSKEVRQALNVPFMCCRLCFEAAKLCPELVKKGNVNLISDVAVAAVMIEGAFASAYFNVDINLKLLQDKALARSMRKELDKKQKTVLRIRKETEEKVGKVIRG
jgi:formiminotetrahydrofolate cyclodeaminase